MIPTIKLNNDVEMPRMGFGVFQVTDLSVCEQAVVDAIESGYRLIDTASSYQNEKAVGRAIGVSNFLPDRLIDLCYNANVIPQINQIERHPHYQREDELKIMKEFGVQPEAWAPFAEGLKGMFTEPILMGIAEKYGKTPAQIILRWNIQNNVIVIPKSVHRERMEENIAIWDFELDEEDMRRIATLDKHNPSMLDTLKPSEVKRVYDYLRNPVLTSLE